MARTGTMPDRRGLGIQPLTGSRYVKLKRRGCVAVMMLAWVALGVNVIYGITRILWKMLRKWFDIVRRNSVIIPPYGRLANDTQIRDYNVIPWR